MDATSESSNSSQAIKTTRKWSVEDRLRIVQASLNKGTTVDAVAKVYGVHASQLYDWRKQHRQGLLKDKTAALHPVQVVEADSCAVPEQPKKDGGVVIEARGARVTISGSTDVVVIRTVLDCLTQ